MDTWHVVRFALSRAGFKTVEAGDGQAALAAFKKDQPALIILDILMPAVGDTFDLIIDAPFAGWAASSQIAVAINAKAQPQGPKVAVAVDERR